MLPLPDLLYPRPTASVDEALLEELLELSFLGSERGERLTEALETVRLPRSTWRPEFFAEGLFLDAAIEEVFTLPRGRRTFPLHRRYLRRVLGRPPLEAETVRFRQAVLRELNDDAEVRRRTEDLHRELFDLLTLFKNPGSTSLRLNLAGTRLDALRQAKRVVDRMLTDFEGATSGLHRLHDVGLEIQRSREYGILAALLDHEEHLAELTLRVRVGAAGRIRHLFAEIRPGAMILLDELCSGTNPSEAVEIVALVLELLRRLEPEAFITTHFLDYTQELAHDPPNPELEFLHAATTDDHVPTYRFDPGVAATSLAADTARRMGVTFQDLADLLTRRFGVERPEGDLEPVVAEPGPSEE